MDPYSSKPLPPPRNGRNASPYEYPTSPSSIRVVDGTGPFTSKRPTFQSTSTFGSSYKFEPTDGVTEVQSNDDKKTSPWGIHWYSPALMVGLFLLGIASSIAHHLFYQSLHNTDVESTMSQEWAIRIGTGLAFITKASLAAAIGVAYTQRLWVTLRQKTITMQGVDDLFLMTVDPTAFFNLEVLKVAKVLFLMAVSMWCIPLIATITPATLSITTAIAQNTTNVAVPILDFGNANTSDHFFEDFDHSWKTMTAPIASIPLRRLLRTVATGGRMLQVSPPFVNSTFEMEFYGPSLKCYNLSAPLPEDPVERKGINQMREMFNFTMRDYYAKQRSLTSDLSNSRAPPVSADHMYYWGMDNHYIYNSSAIPPSLDRTAMSDIFHVRLDGAWHEKKDSEYPFRPYDFSCNIWNTSYSILVDSTQGEQSMTITHLERKDEYHLDFLDYDVYSNHTPQQLAYKGYSDALRLLLSGIIGMSFKGEALNEIELVTSALTFCPELVPAFENTGRVEEPCLCRNGSMLAAVEDLARNFTVSLLSSPALSSNTTVEAKVFGSVNRYTYNWQNLVLAYGAGILVSFCGVLIGGYSYRANGFSGSTSFSRIMLTTRNGDLDGLGEGRCLPSLPLGRELGGVRLRYGLLKTGGRRGEHAAFGFADSVETLRKGNKCR